MKAWYFSNTDCRLRYGDGRLIKPGITHKVDCEPVLCESGLHGSVKPLHALHYAPGQCVWRVELGGEVVRGDDKCVATERTYLWGYDATAALRKFARLCALDVTHLWNAPDVVVRYLRTGDEPLRAAARDAAWDAARAAALAATSDAASDATKDATSAAAWNAAWNATRAATNDAAWNAARAVASDATNDAAWAVARDAQNKRLYRMLMDGRSKRIE